MFMGRAHSKAMKDLGMFMTDLNLLPRMKTVCGVGEGLDEMAARFGWEQIETDWRKVVADPGIDAVTIAVPGFLHKEIAVEAANNKKIIFCEKPLSQDYAGAYAMCEAARQNGVTNMVNFNYRRVPAVVLAKQLIDEGQLGEIVCYKGLYQQDWGLQGQPMSWRYESEKVGKGPLEMGIHITDMAQWLVGDIEKVCSDMKTVVTEREIPGSGGRMGKVTNDDNTAWIAKFQNGVTGLFEASRVHMGRKNFQWFEVNGTKGTLRFELERMNELSVYLEDVKGDRNGFRTILATEEMHEYIKYWWPTGHTLGWDHTLVHQYYELLKALEKGYNPEPSFATAAKTQRVLDAIVRSAEMGSWVKVADISAP